MDKFSILHPSAICKGEDESEPRSCAFKFLDTTGQRPYNKTVLFPWLNRYSDRKEGAL